MRPGKEPCNRIAARKHMLRKRILKNARETVILFERAKLGKTFLHTLYRREEAGVILTD